MYGDLTYKTMPAEIDFWERPHWIHSHNQDMLKAFSLVYIQSNRQTHIILEFERPPVEN